MRALAVGGAGLVATLLLPLLLIATLLGGLSTIDPVGDVDPSAIPTAAAAQLPVIEAVTAAACPELPPLWVVAQVQAESGWDASAFRADRNGGSAGLYQLNEVNWVDAGGAAWASAPPPAEADVLQPEVHLRTAIPWVCRNLREVTRHLATTGKPTAPLDAMLVCHIAGCSRVTGSTTGVPTVGEAGCDATCVDLVDGYLTHVHEFLAAYGRSSGPVPIDDLPAPTPFTGGGSGCTAPDPTGGRCLTPTSRHGYDEIVRVFGPAAPGGPIRSVGCWDEHAWNPDSDHPRGRACDYFPGAAGFFPQGDELASGWRLASWLRAHAEALDVGYLIWQGRFWSPETTDADGWGRAYTGGGVYDPTDATGGHFDHVHVSYAS